MPYTTIRTKTLYFRAGTSDKEYRVSLQVNEDVSPPYQVLCEWGRRGSALQRQVHGPLPEYSAQATYANKVEEKTSKGYTTRSFIDNVPELSERTRQLGEAIESAGRSMRNTRDVVATLSDLAAVQERTRIQANEARMAQMEAIAAERRAIVAADLRARSRQTTPLNSPAPAPRQAPRQPPTRTRPGQSAPTAEPVQQPRSRLIDFSDE